MSKWIDYDAIDYRFDRIQDQSPDFIGGVIYANACVQEAPSIAIEPKRGEWISKGKRIYRCSNCGNYLDFDGVNAGRGDANFCPNCGADMRKGADDE